MEIKNFNQNQNIYPENVTFGLASRMIVNKGILEFCSAAKNIKKSFHMLILLLLATLIEVFIHLNIIEQLKNLKKP